MEKQDTDSGRGRGRGLGALLIAELFPRELRLWGKWINRTRAEANANANANSNANSTNERKVASYIMDTIKYYGCKH